ncbi:hypothetical protein GGTG_10573 [Gaeumannomyces tritici R3-111a-1]|uniref:Uncharacterized protein n=1 Tax=Gaeumannomyces tritici (strain R3-111a-1) TaxID=644352 RepID=J3PAP8_GAET3|nr:hypothetical protein GGTG_10573 [Gaeumannomyces tritici R3-111a-1]EJT71314.1 hypothetical protein GGTG_10573 [Gaeumannomyces tritici R3-111a-1]
MSVDSDRAALGLVRFPPGRSLSHGGREASPHEALLDQTLYISALLRRRHDLAQHAEVAPRPPPVTSEEGAACYKGTHPSPNIFLGRTAPRVPASPYIWPSWRWWRWHLGRRASGSPHVHNF